jgi:hypothetical protein
LIPQLAAAINHHVNDRAQSPRTQGDS